MGPSILGKWSTHTHRSLIFQAVSQIRPLELRQLLEENVLEDNQDRWYIPDPNKVQDLERLRERSPLREFRQYARGKGRLKVFRKEAVGQVSAAPGGTRTMPPSSRLPAVFPRGCCRKTRRC
jgi:hypothetical protein